MSRTVRLALLTLLLVIALKAMLTQQQPPPKNSPKTQQPQEPPEEDESIKPREYSFNPLQATHEVTIGNYYFKKGNYRAAAKRFSEATRWNPSFAEAFLRLGDAEEKLKDRDAARSAYAKYVELAPDAKNAQSIRKKLAR